MSKKAVARKAGQTDDQPVRILRPGTPVLVWTDSVTGTLEAQPGFLSRLLPSGNWSIIYFQRANPSFMSEAEYSDTPKLHRWTFPEAYDEWVSNRSEG